MPKISIIGRGINPEKHLSISALKILCQVDKIVGIEPEKEFWSNLKNEFNFPEIEDVSSLYKNQERDLVNYNRFLDYIFSILSGFNHLALLVPGHPRIGVTFIELMKERMAKGLEIEVIDGISSFDAMITYLDIDPLEQGSVILDANRLLLFQYILEPSLGYFIYHVSSIGNSTTNFLNPAHGNNIGLLQNYLLNFYPKDKNVIFCRIANGLKEKSTRFTACISEIEHLVDLIDYSTTLYIPPEIPRRLDQRYLQLLRGKNEF
ncbi:MAG: SAM-dependent methyltransferase [Waddliaceae bacterium]